jgi:transcriptional regulator with XRE-family HTH domain
MERRGAAQAPMAARLPNLAVPAPAVSFGELLRTHRERVLLSQEKLAVLAGLSARTIRELEAGRVKRPRETSVQLLAQALKLQGSLRQAFEAAARTHPSAQTGDAVPRAADEGCGSPRWVAEACCGCRHDPRVSASGIHASWCSASATGSPPRRAPCRRRTP